MLLMFRNKHQSNAVDFSTRGGGTVAFSITLSLPPPMRPGSGCLSPVPSDMQNGGGVDGELERLKRDDEG